MNDVTVIKMNPLLDEKTQPSVPKVLFESDIKSNRIGAWGDKMRSPWEHARQAVYEWVKPRMNKVLAYDDVMLLCKQMEQMVRQAVYEERKDAFRQAARVAYDRMKEAK